MGGGGVNESNWNFFFPLQQSSLTCVVHYNLHHGVDNACANVLSSALEACNPKHVVSPPHFVKVVQKHFCKDHAKRQPPAH